MPLPWGGTGLLPIRTPPGASLAVHYLVVLAIQVYGFFVARAIWKRDRAGAVLVAIGAAAILAGVAIAVPRRLREGPGAVPGRLAARDLRALRGVLPLAGVLGARRAGGRHREAVRGRLRARPDREGSPRAGRTVSQGQPRALPHPRLDRRGALRTTAPRHHAPDDDDGSDRGGAPATARGEIRAYTVEKRLLRKDGEPVWALLAVSVVPDDHGQPAPDRSLRCRT